MAKALPILAIVAAVAAALGALVLLEVALLLPLLVALVGAGFLIAQRSLPGIVSGLLVLLFAVLGLLGLVGNVSTEEGGVDFGISESLGHGFAVLAPLLVVGGLVWQEWDVIEPRWLQVGGATALGLAAVLALVFSGSLTDQSAVGAYLVALLSLAGLAPGIALLRGD